MQGSVVYNLVFAAIVCVACAIVVSSSAVALRERQVINQTLDMQRNVLVAAGLAAPDEGLEPEEIEARFAPISQVVIDRETGAATDVDPAASIRAPPPADPDGARRPRQHTRGCRGWRAGALV